jgi:hypothetical protein
MHGLGGSLLEQVLAGSLILDLADFVHKFVLAEVDGQPLDVIEEGE